MRAIFVVLRLLAPLAIVHGSHGDGLAVKGSALCDAAMWKTGKDLPGFVVPLVDSWCNAVAQDAVRQARVAREDLASSIAEKGSCWDGLKYCEEKRRDCQQECDREKIALELRFVSAQEKSLANAAYWKQMCEKKISIAQCELEKKAAATVKCHEDRSLVELMPDRSSSRDGQVEYLDDALASCRLQNAYANATVGEYVRRLEDQVYLLYRVLAGGGSFFMVLIVLLVALLLQAWKGGERERPPGSTKNKLRVLTPAQARQLLMSMSEGGNGCSRSILTSVTPAKGSEEYFLLVPMNCFRSRTFALFGCGGDFSGDVEAARDTVAGQPLSIILYDHTGHAFTETVLEDLQMQPQDIAASVIPKDSDYPTGLDVGVLWIDSTNVFLTNADEDSMLTNHLAEQAWIKYLCRSR
ncbi:uncharacterized protein LOC9661859 [Selaginella moellendorffii]|uniref:uncharacterized protein LOC9661859 n=1 Tax=Selaginella moellendorffii TaxID=88036 RepID=UPI000D1C2B8D|nr:uncharacterized protein LOC9661859 [Selaginella moellendorffii]|eukprot:XP_024518508.1 uncharacterized protein LOC9661859 [Selaginella moellendorffii]